MPAPDLTRRATLAVALAALARPAFASSEPAFGDNFAGMPLLDQEGRRFSFEQLKGRIVLVHFVFTGCATVCPVQTRALVDMRAGLSVAASKRLHIVSVSLDPLSDTPAALKAYGQRMDVDFARWSMVTGRPQDIDRVAQSLRLFKPVSSQNATSPPATGQKQVSASSIQKPDAHTTRLWLIDPKGRLVQRYPGDPPDGKRLVREIENLHILHT